MKIGTRDVGIGTRNAASRNGRAARWRTTIAAVVTLSVVSVLAAAQPSAALAAAPTVSAGPDFTCAINAGSRPLCWGRDDHGELGDGPNVSGLRTTPVRPAGLTQVKAISAGLHHTCAIDLTGVAWCWGLNNYGQVGDGTMAQRDKPVKVLTSLHFIAISAGGNFTCAISTAGDPYCWGDNADGELGDNSTAAYSLVPVPVFGQGLSAAAITTGIDEHACMLTTIHSVMCWGNNQYGEVGNGSTTNSPYAVTVNGLTSAVAAVAAGRGHSCALTSTTMVCWGLNNKGQLGDGTTTNRLTPVPVAGLIGTPTQITAGGYHTCVLAQNTGAEVECWGYGRSGQLGDGELATHISTVPGEVFGLRGTAAGGGSGPLSVSAGNDHTCAVMATGWLECWGLNSHGDIGDATTMARAVPTRVLGFTVGIQGVTEGTAAGCAQDGTNLYVFCWGTAAGANFIPQDFASSVDGYTASGLSSGDGATCFISNTYKNLFCWGTNMYGEVGDGNTNSTPTPQGVKTLDGTTVVPGEISVTFETACALSVQSTAYCWGRGDSGQLGDGSGSNEDQPVSVVGINNVSEISAGAVNGCALAGFGPTAYCWGTNKHGAIGDGTTNDSNKPVIVKGLPYPAAQIETGNGASCAIIITGAVYCWGYNAFGQVGNGTTTDQLSPVAVSLPAQAQEVVGGTVHSCALLDDGTVYCWGDNAMGELGNGSAVSNSTTPVQVTGLAGQAIALSSQGAYATCALIASPSEVQCWGTNQQDQLGDGTSGGQSNTPQVVTGL